MKLQIYFKAVFLLTILTGLCSCSDDDPDVREAVVRVVITYSGDYTEFEELLGIQVTSENISSLTVTGTEWDEISHPAEESDVAVWLNQEEYRPLDGRTKTLVTSKKVASLTVSGNYQVKEGSEKSNAPVTANIQLFVKDVLAQTHQVVAKRAATMNSFTIPIVTSDPNRVITQ
ncbi:MAG: hypothetical protein AAGU19_23010 [Prolixibacteraceae bacterium]